MGNFSSYVAQVKLEGLNVYRDLTVREAQNLTPLIDSIELVLNAEDLDDIDSRGGTSTIPEIE